MLLTSIATRLGHSQVARPRTFIAISLVFTVFAGILASHLKFDSSYEALLPEDSAELKNADEVRERTGGVRQIVIAISGENKDKRLEYGRALEPKLEALDGIRTVDLEFPVDFFRDRGLWLMSIKGLDALIPALENAVKVSKSQANPMALHLDEEEEEKELETAWAKVDEIIKRERKDVPFDEVLMSKDERYTFMLVIPSIKFTNMDLGRALLSSIHREIEATKPENFNVEVRTAGQLDLLQEQHATTISDLRNASILALLLGTLIVAGFTRRPNAPFVVGVGLVAGVIWTFAVTAMTIGNVNIITGFLVAVLIGLGIDFGVHLYVRYQQEWRLGGGNVEQAIIKAVEGTLPPALTSALTTAGTFLSFVIADFRGFSEFGFIAGTGVLLTMASSFLILPPLIIIVEKNRVATGAPRLPEIKQAANPKSLCWATVVVIGAIALYGAVHFLDIPFHNNFRQLRGTSDATAFLDYVDENLGSGFNPTVILTKSANAAAQAKEIIVNQKENGRGDQSLSRIGKIFSVNDLLPSKIKAHRHRINKLYKILDDPKLDRAEKKEGKRAKQLKRARKMVKTPAWTAEKLPEEFRSRFMTRDGKEYLVFVWPTERNDSDSQALAWEDETKELSSKLDEAGIEHSMADETLIIAWITHMIIADGPKLLGMAILVVLIFLTLDFRDPRRTAVVFFPLTVGMLVFAALAYAFGLELNMYNIIVVPSIIGIGIDNAVHIYHRYRAEGPGTLAYVVRSTGAAALTASATTAVGFGASLVSHSVGLQGMGTLAIVGITATFVAAVVFFPCTLSLAENYRRQQSPKPPTA